VILPTGTVELPLFVLSADGADFTPAGNANERQPEHIVAQRSFVNTDDVRRSLLADGQVLGLPPADIDQLLKRIGATIGSSAPQQGVLNGLVRDWLAVWVEVIGIESGSVEVNYHFGINMFHNPAVDAVVRAGFYPIDLTHRPGRAELAFRDTYSNAKVGPAWTETLTVQLTLPTGAIKRRAASVTSSSTGVGIDDPRGIGQPHQTIVELQTSSVADAEQLLRADAATLGLPGPAIDAAFRRPSGQHVHTTIPGRATAVGDVEARLDVTVGQPGKFAAGISYVFTYR
jgi:hypothetical protein